MAAIDKAGADGRLTTRRFALDRAEVATTAAAAVVSTAAYLRYGHPYLTRGVLGDLAGFALLAAVAGLRRSRGRHEAMVCLTGIAVVFLARPDWPLAVPDAAWWAMFAAGLAGYLLLRKRVCG